MREKARVSGASHVQAIVSPAQELDAPSGAFELVAIGNAFHRLRREAVAADAFRWLQPDGWIALLWGTNPWYTRDAPWAQAIAALVSRWQSKLEVESRVPAGWEDPRRKRPDGEVLTEAGFDVIRASRFPTVHEWSVEALIGLVYSTSFLPRAVLGDRAEMFEGDLHREFDSFEARNELTETIDFMYELARRPV